MNNKGFTLVELLAVIAILGAISAIAVISVVSYIDEAGKASYNTLVKSIESSTEMYVTDHSSDFPELDTPGSTFTISLSDLATDKYISSKIVDDRTGDVIPLTTTVTVTVGENNKISVHFDYE